MNSEERVVRARWWQSSSRAGVVDQTANDGSSQGPWNHRPKGFQKVTQTRLKCVAHNIKNMKTTEKWKSRKIVLCRFSFLNPYLTSESSPGCQFWCGCDFSHFRGCPETACRCQFTVDKKNNAKEKVNQLTVKYNKARQESITTELIEIISGMEALK